MLKRIITVGLIIAACLFAAQFIPPKLFDFWDFRNNLWGPSHLLVTGRSPYFIKQLFAETNAIWMPPILGLLFPIGWLSLDLASKIWLMVSVASIGLLIFLFTAPGTLWKFALGLLLVFFFPPIILHISLGQVSLLIVLCLILAAFKTDTLFWKSFFCVMALTKPQLGMLVLPGIFIQAYQKEGFRGFLRLCGAAAAWFVALLIPLFIMVPAWIPDFIYAVQDNANWAQPSILFLLRNQLGETPGLIAWLTLALTAFAGNIWLWIKLPAKEAVVWSLALTCLVSPYLWSWDFVLLLPCFLYLLNQPGSWAASVELITGFLAGAFLIWKTRWNTSVPDEVFTWVPAFFIAVYLFKLMIDRLVPAFHQRQHRPTAPEIGQK